MLKIGLTGGIGSGKSTVAQYFANLGIPVIDADVIVHQLLANNSAIRTEIINHFGTRISQCKKSFQNIEHSQTDLQTTQKPGLSEDNTIDRTLLRQIIFRDKNERLWLEKLLHPLVYKEIEKQLLMLDKNCEQEHNSTAHQNDKSTYCIVVLPLLFETGGDKIVDRILVVNVDTEKQIQRTKQRDNISAACVSAIINNQIANTWRLSHANDIIDNNSSLTNTQQQVENLHDLYKKLAKQQKHDT